MGRYNDNAFLAWRRVLDRDASMRVSYEQFLLECKELVKRGFAEAAPPGGATSLFLAIDRSRSGWFSLKAWDEDSFEVLKKFSDFVKEKGNPSKFFKYAESFGEDWNQSNDSSSSGLSYASFSAATRSLGFDSAARTKLFEGLQQSNKKLEGRNGKLKLTDFKFLQDWDHIREANDALIWKSLVGEQLDSFKSEVDRCTPP